MNRINIRKKINEPMVIFPLKEYEDLMEYMEEIEDRLSIMDRKEDSILTQEQVEKDFEKKFGNK